MGPFWTTHIHYLISIFSIPWRDLDEMVGNYGKQAKEEYDFPSTGR